MPHLARLTFALIACLLALVASSAPAHAAGCDVWGAPSGSDRAAGTNAAPLATPQAVADRLDPGQTGCLRAGTYTRTVVGPYVLRVGHGGRSGAPVTLRSAPGERATLRGIVAVPKGSDHVTLADLDVDGRPVRGSTHPTSIQINAADTTLSGNDITNRGTAICAVLGFDGWGSARRTSIVSNTFHDCGDRRQRMQDHAVYADQARDVTVRGNVFVRTAGYAVHLYPDAQRTRVIGNTMVDNGGGVIFAGEGARTSNHNVVSGNVITGSTTRPAIEAYWGGRKGRGNVARDNCVADNPGGNVDTAGGGFTASGNVTGSIRFADAYSLAVGSGCPKQVPLAVPVGLAAAVSPG